MDLDDLKKYLWVLAILIGAGWYVSQHYTFRQVLKYSKEHPSPDYSPMIDYYSGMALYLKDDHEGSIEAFQQLLADYPTCQYAPTAMFRLASSYIERAKYQEARDVLDKYFEDYPKDRNRGIAQSKYEYIKFR